jgi:hypothetical protein
VTPAEINSTPICWISPSPDAAAVCNGRVCWEISLLPYRATGGYFLIA